jgi:hypothetical protein
MYVIQHCFIYRPSDSAVSEDAAGIELRTIATLALTARRSNHLVIDLTVAVECCSSLLITMTKRTDEQCHPFIRSTVSTQLSWPP